ncbi:guanine nucleotide-binding protein subunit gamma, other [Cryptococcus neoformans Bt85]|nr:guanine nucleotide-binding protein subunit gamma, other [Cryptococcus neoformans var. grubii Bt85]OXM75714.1 guanine nucleotide-binding protein subunit gamma, other [Cryptococcus neoformans var. grubii Bt63]
MTELKLRRLMEHNHRLREELARPRVTVSIASISLINYCRATKDPLIPSVWGPLPRSEDPYAPVEQAVCCSGKPESSSSSKPYYSRKLIPTIPTI